MDEQTQSEYFELLRFPTIGADPLHLRDCVQCAMWLKAWLARLGFAGELMTEGGHPPFLFAERKGTEGAPTVLLYGHYDVQPPDPLDEWETPPFEPTMRGDRIHARGAQDDKGQFFAFLCGMRDYLSIATGEVPSIKVLLEGQEESGSVVLGKLAPSIRAKLKADVLAVCDTSAAKDLRPAIVAGLRGVSHFTVRLQGANRDLHSGEYGGIAPNAAQGMAELLASLHNLDGSIAVAGFRDGIIPPTHEELSKAEEGAQGALGCEETYRADIGTDPCGGQMGKTIVQRNSFEPTIEINGIHSGYGGPGSKTVIPCEAIAKISTRLVPGQNPQRTFDAIKKHLKDRCPKGMTVSFPEDSGLSAAMRLPLASPVFRLAADLLAELDPRGPVFQWDGASIPVISALKDASGAAPLLVGWGQAEDRIHAPDESYSLSQFTLSGKWAEMILEALASN